MPEKQYTSSPGVNRWLKKKLKEGYKQHHPQGAADQLKKAIDTNATMVIEGYKTFQALKDKLRNEKYMKEKYGSIEAATKTRKRKKMNGWY